MSDDAAKEAVVEAMNSQTATIDARELKAILEAVLFVSPEPVPVARLISIVGTVSKAEVVQALEILTHDLDQPGRGIQLGAGRRRVSTGDKAGVWALAETNGESEGGAKTLSLRARIPRHHRLQTAARAF